MRAAEGADFDTFGGRAPRADVRRAAFRYHLRMPISPRRFDVAPELGHRPPTLRALAWAQRGLHRISSGRLGAVDPAAAAPRGAALRLITKLHRALYRWTGGRIGDAAGGMPTLLLTTIGHKTGQPRTVPLPYFKRGDEYLLVASFAGSPVDPAWYRNLVANPAVTVQVGKDTWRGAARAATTEERAVYWDEIVAVAPMYGDYQRQTERQIPVVVVQKRSGP